MNLQLILIPFLLAQFSIGLTELVAAANSLKNEQDVPLLERFKRSPVTLDIFYHPGNPYSCYATSSKLYCTSKAFSLEVHSTNTVRMLKQLIETEYDYPADLQIIKYGLRVLRNEQTLSSYNIQDNDMLDLTLSSVPNE